MGSARPARGALLASVFAMVLLALVVTYQVDGSDDPSLTAGTSEAVAATDGADLLRAAQSRSLAAQARSAVGPGSVGPVDDEAEGLSDVPLERVMSKVPTDVPPAAPTTVTTAPPTTAAPTTRPPTTRPPTTQPPTTAPPAPPTDPAATDPAATDPAATDPAVPAETAPTGDPAAAADPTASTDTTAPPTTEPPATAPPATAHPEGWVDAGHGIFVPQVLLAIRYCESRDNYTAANPSSSARGAYQFLTGSWADYGHAARYGVKQAHLATPAQQDEAALITWQRSGTRPWNASRSCWN